MAPTRKFTLINWLAAGFFVALLQAVVAQAAGLGRLNVLSQMGQPFVGEIELVNVSRDELSTLSARVAPAAAYQAANLRFDPALNSMRLSVEQRANGMPYLRAASTRPVSEPYLDLLVELNAQSGRFVRQYSALLDPPGLVEPPAAAKAPAPAAPAPAVQAATPVSPRPAPAPRAAAAPAPAASTPIAPAPAAAPRIAAAPVTPAPAPGAMTPPPPKAVETPKLVEAPKAEVAKPKAEAPAAESPKTEAPAAAAQKSDAPPAEAPKPADSEPTAPTPPAAATAAKSAPPAPPAPQRGMLDSFTDYLLPIGTGVLALLAGLGFWLFSRRKQATPAPAPAAAPQAAAPASPAARTVATPAAAATSPVTVAATAEPRIEPTVANVTEMVDPLEEAQVYLDHGADGQAEDILRKALASEPRRADLQVKLLEILANRGDKSGFNTLARTLREQTGGTGEHWSRASLLGAAVDPGNPLYPTSAKAASAAQATADAGVDFDLGGTANKPDTLNNTADILLTQPAASTDMEKTMVLKRDDIKPAAPPAEAPLDFNFELPAASTPAAKPAPAPAAKAEDRGLDFKIDIPDVNLNLDDKSAPAINPAFEVKSAQWEEVQQKFDLVLAYKEMGDKDGMLEALQEIEREGDAAQKAHAQKMMQELKGA